MSKIKLDLDALNVDSFDTTPIDQGGGTVLANQMTYVSCVGPCLPPSPIGTCLSCAMDICPERVSHHFTCNQTCHASCLATCQQTCQPTCQQTCYATCFASCQVICGQASGQVTCRPSCHVSCGATCFFSCGGHGYSCLGRCQ